MAQPSNGITTIIGNLTVYNRNSGFIVNQFNYNGYDVVKSLPNNNNYLTLLYDRQGNGLRSKLIEISVDGQENYSLTNTFTKPISLNIVENGNYYVTDSTGQIGTLFFRQFVPDGASGGIVSSTSGNSNSSGGSGGSGITGPGTV